MTLTRSSGRLTISSSTGSICATVNISSWRPMMQAWFAVVFSPVCN